MKHINKYLVILLGIFALTVVSSCNKEDSLNERDFSEKDILSIETRALPRHGYGVTHRDATRKLIEFRRYDYETREETIMYDCTIRGQTCDVGEDLEKGKVYLILPYNDPAEIISVIYSNEDSLKSVFPVFYIEPVKQGIIGGAISLDYTQGFLILRDTLSKDLIFGYNIDAILKIDSLPQEPVYEYRKTFHDTEDNIFRCLVAGTNCRVLAPGSPEPSRGSFGSNLQYAFPDINMFDLILDGTYTVYYDRSSKMYIFESTDNELYETLYMAE